jgi:hypothetical protein
VGSVAGCAAWKRWYKLVSWLVWRILLGALQIKIIDFGAACDLATGINFNPLYGMLDPRYSPPEELVMPQGEAGPTVKFDNDDIQQNVFLTAAQNVC